MFVQAAEVLIGGAGIDGSYGDVEALLDEAGAGDDAFACEDDFEIGPAVAIGRVSMGVEYGLDQVGARGALGEKLPDL